MYTYNAVYRVQRHALLALQGGAPSATDGASEPNTSNGSGAAEAEAPSWEPTASEPKPVAASIRKKLEQEFAPSKLDIVDESHKHAGHAGAKETISPSGETHLKLHIVSEKFAGMNSVRRHRAVFGLLKEELAGPVHALSLETKAPEEA
jgi:stress-induced morphogen